LKTTPQAPAGIEIIAHRGSGQGHLQPDTPPENTLPAFAYAWSPAVNADAAELDIHLTLDGEIVVIHDDTTDRTANAAWVVAEHTLAELRTLDAGKWKAPQFAGTRLPTLDEVIGTIPDGKRLFTEIKTDRRILDPLVRVLRGCGKPAGQLPLISFNIDAIGRAKERLPEHECYLLVTFENPHAADSANLDSADLDSADLDSANLEAANLEAANVEAMMDALIRLARNAGLDGIDTSFPMPRGWLDRMRRHQLKSVVWTVNDVEAAREVATGGIGGITTDVPRQIRAALRGVRG